MIDALPSCPNPGKCYLCPAQPESDGLKPRAFVGALLVGALMWAGLAYIVVQVANC